jgi:hypothetical protein
VFHLQPAQMELEVFRACSYPLVVKQQLGSREHL